MDAILGQSFTSARPQTCGALSSCRKFEVEPAEADCRQLSGTAADASGCGCSSLG